MNDAERPVAPPGTLGELFWGFFAIGARGFGGVLPWAYRTIVEERRWMTLEAFQEIVSLCQFLPGPNIGNAAIVLGRRWFGLRGAVVAFLGMFALPFVWVLAFVVLLGHWVDIPLVRAFVTGMGIAGGGLFIATAIKLGRPLWPRVLPLAIAATAFGAVGLARLPLLWVFAVLVPVALALARAGKL